MQCSKSPWHLPRHRKYRHCPPMPQPMIQTDRFLAPEPQTGLVPTKSGVCADCRLPMTLSGATGDRAGVEPAPQGCSVNRNEITGRFALIKRSLPDICAFCAHLLAAV